MKAAVLSAIGQLEVREIPDPVCGPKDMVVQVRACTVCGTDVKIFHHGHPRVHPPHVIGHEIAGSVAALGQEVGGFQVGDPVVVAPAGVGCGTCSFCTSGQDNLCEKRRGMGYEWLGGFAEYVLIPEPLIQAGCIQRIPDTIGFKEAAITEPLACVLNAHDRLRLAPGETVAILGAGPIGLMHAMVARAAGVKKIMVIDVQTQRIQALPGSLGAVGIDASREDPLARVRGETGGVGADAVIVAAPSPAAQQQALELARKGGKIAFFSGLPYGTREIPLDTNKIHYRELVVFGSSGARVEHARKALDYLSRRMVDGGHIVTHELPLDDLVHALQGNGPNPALKVAIVP